MSARFRVLPTVRQQTERDQRRRRWNKAILVTLFLLPGMTLFVVFVLIPIAQSAVFSLYKWDGFGPPTNYLGLGNYKTLLNTKIFQSTVLHSFGIMGLSLAIQLPLALALALLVGRGKLHGKRIFRAILFIPYVFSEVITGLIWRYVLTPGPGLANLVLASLIPGFKPVAWLAEPNIVLYAYFAVLTWKYFGFHMILYMAGLQAIPADLEDAARVDGASERNVLQHITLPMLGSTVRLTVFLSVLGSFQQFVLVWVLTQGGPSNASELIATYLYKYGIQRFMLGYGSAVAIVLFLITLVFSLGYQRIIMKQDFAVGETHMTTQQTQLMPRTQQVIQSLLKYTFLIILCLVIAGPVVTAVLGSIRTTGEFTSAPFGLPVSGIHWENYADILSNPQFWVSFKNSLVITISVTVLNLILGSMLAFVFSRVDFFGRRFLFNVLLLGLLFPLVVAILPIFIQVRQLGLINSEWGVILPLVAFGLPGSVVILRSFFTHVPGELEDASYIDGCSTFGFFRYILVPLARPAMISVAVLQVIASWNEYFLPLLVLNDPDKWPLPLGIMQFQGQFGTDYARIMAYVTLLIIPAVLFYLVAEKYIVTGLTGGELKG